MKKNEEDKVSRIFRVSELVSDFIGERLEADGKNALDVWLEEQMENKELFDNICSEKTMQEKIRCYKDNDAEKAFEKFVKKRNQHAKYRVLYRIFSGAAIIALFLGGWYLIRLQENQNYPQPWVETLQQDSSVNHQKPLLTLSDGTQMNVLEDNLPDNGMEKEDSTAQYDYNTLEIPALCDFNLTLSDGTKVWMNAASTLKYPITFAADSRTIFASGEIYLEVAKDAARPFYVVVDGITVKVLGTSFNIRAYENENDTKITLIEGKIAAQTNSKEYILTPGKQLKRGKTFGGVGIETVDPAEIIAWMKGYYVFKKSRLQDVATTLQNWYGVTIMTTSDVSATTTYTGVVNKKESLDVFLRRLEEVSNVRCRRNGNYVTIY